VILLPQKRNKFPEKLDFRTSVGHLDGGRSRQELGAPGKGPERVITNLGVYGFDDESREMTLEAIHPGVSLEEVKAEVGWPLRVKEPLASTVVPDWNALRLLREELDPKSIYLGG
jgi:glutaconate CoA-transferase subunit B